jgi:hypothetical protein
MAAVLAAGMPVKALRQALSGMAVDSLVMIL